MASSRSLLQEITFGAGALIFGPVVAAYPVWLMVLSYRLPGHLAGHADFPTGPTRCWQTGWGTCGLGSRNAA